MFDPTAYENMKVVLEGAVYDLDLSGKIKVTNRKDIIDLASLSRQYELQYTLDVNNGISVLFRIEAKLEQMAAELLNDKPPSQAGVYAFIEFMGSVESFTESHCTMIKEMWGSNREMEEIMIVHSSKPAVRKARLDFHRIITEEMIDDILEMVNHTVKTLSAMR
ncbi:hypothetical protein [Falsibacillus albus]|uniref:Group-specific protein n=1 Tax=Falsibacillus albus TaxID=2478915 RepID=A0A3L7JXB9_9BACI|nr:hypothetical protein [Falsibacillus albus]RLQ95170.1 hypothetical protein D9X91_11790 [Falsibacillus albus]